MGIIGYARFVPQWQSHLMEPMPRRDTVFAG